MILLGKIYSINYSFYFLFIVPLYQGIKYLLLVLYFSLWAALFSDIHQGEKPYEQVTARVFPVIKTSLSYYDSKSPFDYDKPSNSITQARLLSKTGILTPPTMRLRCTMQNPDLHLPSTITRKDRSHSSVHLKIIQISLSPITQLSHLLWPVITFKK